jgi:flagellar basal body-associated protein FliL
MTKTAPRKVVVKKTPAVSKPALKKISVKLEKKDKKKVETKVKVVRDSFTMPQSDYDLIAGLKEKALKADLHVKKSEILRACLQTFSKMTAAQIKRAITGLEKIKTGRPKKD